MYKRSSHHDWFKGNKNKKNSSPKDSLKVFWKFFKIFLYFTLFIFSMWGCVQVLILKNDPGIGKGTELFTSSKKMAPTVISTEIFYDKGKNPNSPLDDIYSVSTKSNNIWINDKEDKDLLKSIHEEIRKQTGGKDLDAANKGGNLAANIVLKDKSGKTLNGDNPKHKYISISKSNGKPIVISTISKKLGSWATNAPTPELSSIKFYDLKNLKTFKEKININTPPKLSPQWYYGVEYANSILRIGGNNSNRFKTWFNQDILKITNKDDRKKYAIAHNDVARYLLSVMRIDEKSIYNKGIFGYSSSNFVPMSNWSQAWSMERGSGPFYGIFVYPISYIANKILNAFPLISGWESFLTIVISVVLISIITFALSFKGLLQQTKMQELNAKKAIIDAKYAAYKGNKQMEMRKRQEVQEMYKKEGISPLSSISMMFITMPFFLAMYRITASIQQIKGTVWLDINFASTSWRELLSGHWQYLWIMVLAAGLQMLSQLYPRLLTRKRDKNRTNVHQQAAMKKNNKTQNIMMIVFAFISIIFNAGLQVYFIVRASWSIFQATIMHNIIVQQKKKAINKARA